MLKVAVLLSLLISHSLVAEDWVSLDKAFGFTLPDKWKVEAQEDKSVEAQFRSPDGARAINISVSSIPANFHLAKKTVVDSVAKMGGKVLTFDDKTEQGDSTVRYTMDIPSTGQFSVVMKFSAGKSYKWQAFTEGKVADDTEIVTAAKTVKLIK